MTMSDPKPDVKERPLRIVPRSDLSPSQIMRLAWQAAYQRVHVERRVA